MDDKLSANSSGGTKTDTSLKRKNYLKWEDYFMATAFLAGQRSKDPETQVGACIVENKNNIIVGIGYNGMPRGCHDDDYSWDKKSPDELKNKYPYVVHAEVNAIVNKNIADLKDCTIYVSLFPCNECAKFIIQSGIKQVVYMSDKDADKDRVKASKKMFASCDIIFRKFEPTKDQIVIDFTKIKQYSGPSTQ